MVKFPLKIVIIFALLNCAQNRSLNDIYEFSKFQSPNNNIDDKSKTYLNRITTDELQHFVQLATESVNNQARFEMNLLNSQITVLNGTISHVQLLDALPNAKAKADSEVAKKILKSSLYIYNSKCAEAGISGDHCAAFFANKPLPNGMELLEECKKIVENRRDGHHPFRRLLPRNYADGFYEMYSEDKLPAPRFISSKALWEANDGSNLDENHKNLALIQWSQFIEHDLSKPVVTSMGNGYPIECCNKDDFKLQPRYHHSACAPLLSSDAKNKYARESCINYVRSALAVGSKCSFGAAEQLNQATAYLDLSQLYGFTSNAQHSMRSYSNGHLKSSQAANVREELLPKVTTSEKHEFCAFHSNDTSSSSSSLCFLAGDSRVNSNPFAIAIYTIFLRNHNRIADKLRSQQPDWSDEKLYLTAKSNNINMYRYVIFNEWLPEILGNDLAKIINEEPFISSNGMENNFRITNEFAVAAIRFYFSMLPNTLHNFVTVQTKDVKTNIVPEPNVFILKDHIYKPNLMYTSEKLNQIMESLLHQRAMKMDGLYVDSLIGGFMGNSKPTRADILAYDIQRGRDHGLQSYIKYLELCAKVKINSWEDLRNFISQEDILKLKSVYTNWSDIDLIIGGIYELPATGSTLGPTFTCIIAEQFSKLRQWHHIISFMHDDYEPVESLDYRGITAADILCINSDLKYVPKNIFQLASVTNPLIACDDNKFGFPI